MQRQLLTPHPHVDGIEQLKATPVSVGTVICASYRYGWETANAPYISDEMQPVVTTVESDHESLSVGAWVRDPVQPMVQQAGVGAIARDPFEKLKEMVSPHDYGAVGDGRADDTSALQNAIDFVHRQGGGSIRLKGGATYRILRTLVIGSFVNLDLNGAKILMGSSNTAIVEASKDSMTQGWSIQGPGILEYERQQSASQTGSVGIRMAKRGVQSFNFVLQGPISIVRANTGIGSPPEKGCAVFDGVIDSVIVTEWSHWATDIDCDTMAGSGTNMNVRNLWALQTAGQELPNSKGHRFRGMVGLRASNLLGDHLRGEWLYLESCTGEIGHLAFERCVSTARSGQSSLIAMIACPSIRIGEIYGYQNAINVGGGGECYVVRADGGLFDLHTIRLVETDLSPGSGSIYIVNPTESTRVRNELFALTDRKGRSIAADLADFGLRKRVLRWNVQDRMRVREGGGVEIFAATAPAKDAWSVGDMTWNTVPGAGKPIGWVCVAAGAPGQWASFGTIGGH